MKIRNRKKGRGIRAILCGLLSICCIALGSMSVSAQGYTSDTHPKAKLSPDGTAWTILEPLPYYDSYDTFTEDKKHWNGKQYSFWLEKGEELFTGMTLNLPNPGVGQHAYSYERHGNIPVYKWVVGWDAGKCIHGYNGSEYAGYMNIENKVCYNAYWSGLLPYCADCGKELVYMYHYINADTAKEIQYINVDKRYFYMCPHGNNHSGMHLEQGDENYEHVCEGVSYNQYKIVYKKTNEEAVGVMTDSFHMYNNATEYEGIPVEPVKNLSLNRYERDGYEFLGWNTKADGSGTSYADGAEIFNLTTENHDPDDFDHPDQGVVTLYAQWGRSTSHLKIDTKGGKYEDGRGVVNGDKTTYENIPYKSKLKLKEEYLTPPKGYKVSFETNCATHINPMQTEKIFNSWKKGTPFTGRLIDDTFSFLGGHNTWSVIEAVYDNGSIILPSCNNGDETLVGWYEDAAKTIPAGVPGEEYTPSRDTILYADWEKDLVGVACVGSQERKVIDRTPKSRLEA